MTGFMSEPLMSTDSMDSIVEISAFTASCGLSGGRGQQASASLDDLGGIWER